MKDTQTSEPAEPIGLNKDTGDTGQDTDVQAATSHPGFLPSLGVKVIPAQEHLQMQMQIPVRMPMIMPMLILRLTVIPQDVRWMMKEAIKEVEDEALEKKEEEGVKPG